ncbi:deoxyribose-phosphate aldolase [Geoalkalibacter halelectricus]|uniref:Deoxyribose-phosphate aldolase n=1 Tax=Geoalkalibacter halelectricus TaxID=2847045 RepID=A0ABY5ZTR0_9BACT|nr:deoxyribose-phosphate aldolase [Geoalkalibacter halelectricus]MDO3376711.1 deoxyribose-phosphate aldolase [Geoalkalibacter halelectricus]UWZ81337.1 deoxyribose-phosphate aldolase [Geoalkalibacter halelectricus]
MNPAAYIDHTLLKPDAVSDEVRALCEEAVEYQFAAVCVAPVFVPLAADLVYGSDVCVATVVGFPLGYQTPEAKAYETAQAVRHGAREIDMVIQLGAAREGDFKRVEADIAQVVRAAEGACVKAILECCYFSPDLKRRLAEVALRAGARWLKTSTGFGPAGATYEDVQLLVEVAGGAAGVKAAGGIRDWARCREFLRLGAGRIGTSAGVAIMNQWRLEQQS